MLASHNSHLQPSRHFPASSSTSSTSPNLSSQNRNYLNLSHSSATTSPSSETNAKLQHYFDLSSSGPASSVVLDTSNIPIDNIELYMPNSVDFQSNHSRGFPYASADDTDLSMWQLSGGNSGVANQIGSVVRGQNHQRMPSSSSIGSTMSAVTASPFQGAPRNLRVPDQTSSKQDATRGYRSMSARGHLPSPAPTPTRNTFVSPTSSNFNQQEMNSTMAASLGLNQALDDDMSQMSHSNRVSFSSVGQGPATPMTAMGDDERQRMISNDTMNNSMVTVNNSVPDLFYSQNMPSQQTNPNFLMPHGGSVNERLLEAQMARSVSSGSNQSMPRSPMKYQTSPQTDSEPKTISPKDAVLDYHPTTSDFPLFGQSSVAMNGSFATVTPQRSQFQQQPVMPSISQAWQPSLQAMSTAQMPSYNTFATPSLPSSMSMNSMNGFIGASGANPRRTVSRQPTDQTPEFPAQLASMESSASEAAPPSSGGSTHLAVNIPKPVAATADSGTYSCTYHGCLQRFSTPQKLQKHKRDIHRNNPHVTPGVGSGMSTSQLMERNSQSGPHKCGRVNPTTGKICNAIFSRPYDLTRHEDTIHNARKQRVRCAICTEEKMFSRSDALTRHMRVVHPEVDFPGKHRKRGSRGD